MKLKSILAFLLVALAVLATAQVQSVEYIRLGGRVIAIERNSTGPSLTCAVVNSGTVNTFFDSGTPTVTGGAPPYMFSLATGSLLGLSLDPSTGAVTGIPDAAGTFSIQVRDSNNVAAGNTCPFTITAGPLTISTTTLPEAALGISYSVALAATGGIPPYTWSLAAGDLPNGLILSDNGTISGTPSSSGTFNFTVRVTDSSSAMDTRELSITASAPYANFNISAPSFRTNDTFTIWLNTNLPNTSFTLCWTFPNGSQDCSPNWGQTDANGYWSQTGYFPPGLAGSWQEWVVFPGLVTSSPINFTVSDFASFSISSGFHVGDSFTLSLQTSIPNTSFRYAPNSPMVRRVARCTGAKPMPTAIGQRLEVFPRTSWDRGRNGSYSRRQLPTRSTSRSFLERKQSDEAQNTLTFRVRCGGIQPDWRDHGNRGR